MSTNPSTGRQKKLIRHSEGIRPVPGPGSIINGLPPVMRQRPEEPEKTADAA